MKVVLRQALRNLCGVLDMVGIHTTVSELLAMAVR
jgi:hypothetical protein